MSPGHSRPVVLDTGNSHGLSSCSDHVYYGHYGRPIYSTVYEDFLRTATLVAGGRSERGAHGFIFRL